VDHVLSVDKSKLLKHSMLFMETNLLLKYVDRFFSPLDESCLSWYHHHHH